MSEKVLRPISSLQARSGRAGLVHGIAFKYPGDKLALASILESKLVQIKRRC